MESTILKRPKAEKVTYRTFSLDGSSIEICFRYDENSGRYIGDFPDFEQDPLYTATGRPWVSAVQDMCCHGRDAEGSLYEGTDCGSCFFFMKESEDDVIGICGCGALRQARFADETSTGQRFTEGD
jgi:hypothetical protein